MKKAYYALIFVLFMLPVILGYAFNSNLSFSGMLSATDGNNYLSIMNQAKDGHLLFTNMYTSEEVAYLNARPTFLLAGWLSYITGLSNIFVYHLFRLIGIFLFVFFLEKLIKLVNGEKNSGKTLFICLFASGIGFIFKALTLFGIKQYGSVDLWIVDANNFLTLLSHPHTIISIALMVASVYYFLRWNKSGKMPSLLISAIFALIIGFEHLFDVITLCLAILIFMIDKMICEKKIDFRKILQLAIFGLIVIIPAIYTFILFTQFPDYSSWDSQNLLDTPKFLHVIFGYGFMFFSFFAVLIYSLSIWKKAKPGVKFMLFWIISVLMLIYSPFNIQRRFFEGVHVPFGIVTGIFLFTLLPKYVKLSKAAVYIIIALMLPTNIYLFANTIATLNNERGSFPYDSARYLYYEETDALRWLAANSKPDERIFSTYNIGNYIPAYMNRRVYLGHWAQTIDFNNKTQEVDKYYKGETLLPGGINYIWYGVDEKAMNPTFKADGLEIAYQNEKVTIYRIK